MVFLKLHDGCKTKRTSRGEYESRIGTCVVRVVQQVARERAQLQILVQPPATAGVDECCAGRRNFTRAWALVFTVPGGAELGIAAAIEFLSTEDEKRRRRDVVEIRVVIESDAACDLSTHFDRISLAEIGAGLYLEPAQARAPAIPEEEEIGCCLVSLDQVGDPLLIEVDAKLGAAVRVAGGQVELQTRFGLQVRIPSDEAAP